MISNISNFLWSMWEIAGQLPNETGGVKDEPFDLKQPMLYETMALQPLILTAGQQVPRDVIVIILSKLSPKELLKVGLVCKLWHEIASMNRLWRSYPIMELFPFAPVIDRDVWDTYVKLEHHKLVFEREGQLCGIANKRHYFELLQMSSEVEDGQGISILTLPKGLSLNKIIAFAPAPMTGNATQVHVLWQEIIEKQGDVELGETVTVAITNGVFKDSRKKEVAKQIELVKGLKCEMPQVVVVAALAILRFRSSDPYNPLRLFGDDPWTYTRCMEIVGVFNLVFGGFAPGGPSVSSYSHGKQYVGVGGLRKFEAIDP